MEYVLKTNALCKNYKNFKALNGLTMNVPKGAIYGFVGKNGAGKTTLIRLICGLQKPESGNYVLYGLKNSEKGILKARRRMGAVVETPSIYLELTAVDNLKEQYRILGIPSYDSIPDLLKLVGLENTGKKKAKNFSLGMKQRLGIAVALAGDPDFLVLDEPVNGLDPQGIIEMRELILKLNREYQITVLISSHILDELSRLATHYGFIDNGRMVKEISAEELEESCRKCVRIEVTNVKALVRVLDEMKTDYNIISDNVADIFAKINISKLTLLNNNKAVTAVICILTAFLFLIIGAQLHKMLSEPETNMALVMTDNGQEYQELPNPKFLDGGGRKTVQFFYDFLPGGQVVQCTSLETENLSLLPVYSLVIVVLTTSAGMFFFKKKELK